VKGKVETAVGKLKDATQDPQANQQTPYDSSRQE
jgi:hypothetical protein